MSRYPHLLWLLLLLFYACNYMYGVEKVVILICFGCHSWYTHALDTGFLELNSCSDHQLDYVLGRHADSTSLLHYYRAYWSYLLPVGVLNQLILFDLFVSLVWKGPKCSKLSIKNTKKVTKCQNYWKSDICNGCSKLKSCKPKCQSMTIVFTQIDNLLSS